MHVRTTLCRTMFFGGFILLFFLTCAAASGQDLNSSAAAPQANTVTGGDALVQLLIAKGVLNADEAKSLGGTPAEQRAKLLELLREKGVLSAADYQALTAPSASKPVEDVATTTPSASAQVDRNLVASTTPILPAAVDQATAPKVAETPKPAPPAVIPAVAPVRVFPVDPPKKGGLNGLKVGPVTLAPYGFIKATAVYDSSDPNGDDFPFPGIWLTTTSPFNTGPTTDPAWHVKARSTRFGMNFEWPDISPKLTITGKIEGDFEGNFSEVDNRDVSSIRSNEPQLRLAFVRMDYQASDKTDLFFLGGQDWTLFGSGALPNILETTFLGAYWGDVYERSPQLTVGLIETMNRDRNVKLEFQGGIMMPSSSQILKLGSLGLAGQIGEAEYEGAQSSEPEWQGRLALSFQLDKAPGVAPAQIALAGFRAKRTSVVTNANATSEIEAALDTTSCPTAYASYCSVGFNDSSKLYGGQLTWQLPTRWFTIVGSLYRGGDLRFYFGGQVNSYVTDASGLTSVVGPFVTTDGGPMAAAGNAYLGTNSSGQVVVAPQKPVRSFGGFINLGLPLSRWFKADPKGHNAGWQLYLDLGKDQMVDRDLNNHNFIGLLAPLPMSMGKMAAATLYYKVNNWASFGFEQSIYATRGEDGIPLYTIKGIGSNEWQDHRTEFGPIFTF